MCVSAGLSLRLALLISFCFFFFHIEGGLKINMQVYYSNLPKIAQDVGFIHAFNLS